jgi:hypothetical protein
MKNEVIINLDGDTWRVLSTGANRDGKVYCHLASTTRFRQQKNGKNPIQMCDWVDESVLQNCQQLISTGVSNV